MATKNLSGLNAAQPITLGDTTIARSATGVIAVDSDDVLMESGVGTSANQLVRLNGSAELPAISGANLTNLPSAGGLPFGQYGKQFYNTVNGTNYFAAPCHCSTFTGSLSLIANRFYLMPLVIPLAVTIEQVSIIVTTGSAATGVRLGLYNCDTSTMKATTLLFESAEIDVTSTGHIVDTTVSQLVSPGFYWACLHSESTAVIMPGAGTFMPLLGASIIGTSVTVPAYFRKTLAYTTSLPADLSADAASSWVVTAASAPAVFFKV